MTAISDESHCSPATLLEITDAVVSQIKCGPVRTNETIEMYHVEPVEPDDEMVPHIAVRPGTVSYLPLDRVSNRMHAEVIVKVTSTLATGERKHLDPMFGFVERLADSLRCRRLDAKVAARCIKVEQSQMDYGEWSRRRRFAMQLTLTFELAV